MKVIQFEQHGEPEVLQLVEFPQPVPRTGEVLIKVKAIGLCRNDAPTGNVPSACALADDSGHRCRRGDRTAW